MSVLIKGMGMPTDCALLLKIFPDGSVGVPVHLNWAGTMVVNDAKAVPVPPHGRLIDADALIRDWPTGFVKTADVINDAPTIIPADPEKENEQ